MRTFGALIKQRREAYGITTTELADAVGVSRVSIRDIEEGSKPRYDTALRIMRVLDIEVGDIAVGKYRTVEEILMYRQKKVAEKKDFDCD